MKYTIEIIQLVPNRVYVTVEADNLHEAIAQAQEYDGDDWELDWDNTTNKEVESACEGEHEHVGRDLLT